MFKLISWNLLRLTGASLDDVVRLIEREDPDLLLMQEATREMDGLIKKARRPISAQPHAGPCPRPRGVEPGAAPEPVPVVLPLQAGAMFHRVCQISTSGRSRSQTSISRTARS